MPSLRCFRSLALAAMLSFALPAMATPAKDVAVPTAQAATRIEAMIAELQAQRSEASGRYYDGAAYLERLFRKADVYPRAMQYAASWGDNTVYLNWNSAQAFYDAHLDALRSSLARVRNGRAATTADLDYLAAGVRRWRQEEDRIDADLTRSAELYAQQARKLGERMAIDDSLGALPSAAARAGAEPQRAQLAAEAETLRHEWLIRNPTASEKAQDVRQADSDTLIEVFKYTAKHCSKGRRSMNAKALHTIYKALRGIRTFQSLGGFGTALEVSEEGEEMQLKGREYSFLKHEQRKWIWEGHDWKSKGEALTGYEPSEAIEKFRTSIEPCNATTVTGNSPPSMTDRNSAQTYADKEHLKRAETLFRTIQKTITETEEMLI